MKENVGDVAASVNEDHDPVEKPEDHYLNRTRSLFGSMVTSINRICEVGSKSIEENFSIWCGLWSVASLDHTFSKTMMSTTLQSL